MDNILTDIMFNFDESNPNEIARSIASKAKQKRLSLNLTRETLAKKSGVSLGSIKRFEDTGEISLKHILMLAVVLDATEEFFLLFPVAKYNNINDLLHAKKIKTRKRGRSNV